METLKHLRAIHLLPGMAAVLIPAAITALTGLDIFDLWQSLPATRFVLPLVGVVFIALGLVLMVATIRLFVKFGKGTLAPWNPPQRLVVRGVYRHVRNPKPTIAIGTPRDCGANSTARQAQLRP